jgi:hypothetical protein
MYKGENWVSYENEKSITIKVRNEFKMAFNQIKKLKVNQDVSFMFIIRLITRLIKDLLDL